MDTRIDALLEELGAALVLASPADRESLTDVTQALARLQAATKEEPDLAPTVSQWGVALARVTVGEAPDPSAVLAALGRDVDRLRRGVAAPPAAGAERTFVLPEHVDAEIFADFLANQKLCLDDLEAAILELRASNAGKAVGDVKRRLHTLKGEAGVLGLEDLEHVCHFVEDLLAESPPSYSLVDPLLRVLDWIRASLESYAAGALPEPRAPGVRALLVATDSLPAREGDAVDPSLPQLAAEATDLDAGSPDPSASAAAPDDPTAALLAPFMAVLAPRSCPEVTVSEAPASEPRPEGEPGGAEEHGWDEDQVMLVGEFLQESTDGLASVDQILLEIEQSGIEAERVNRLFRVFHTIKGVSGFLDLHQITELAHTTETMLDGVRSGRLEAKPCILDLVFDATALMRELTQRVRTAVTSGHVISRHPGVAELVERLTQANEGRCDTPAPEVVAEPGERLGEILVRRASITPSDLDRALLSARSTGRRVGEELVASGVVPPKEVAQALRAQTAARGQAATKIKEVVKVDLERVDALVETIGELVIVESMVSHAPEMLGLPGHVRNYMSQLAKITRELQEIGMRMRMVPVRGEFHKMTRMVRDLSRKAGKDVRVEVTGEATEMDRSMVERIADPLVHLIRNAVDHGIEPPDARVAAGKPRTGTVRLSAFHEGGSIVVQIADDGRGIDRDKVLAKAIAKGVVRPDAKLTDAEIHELIFAPGFSTADQVTEVSGRGVGMDVVKRNIESMRGRIVIQTALGKGTTFRIVLPLTLAIIDGMVVRAGAERFIVPTLSIIESLQPEPGMLKSMAGQHELIVVRGESLPLLRIDLLLGIQGAERDATRGLVVIVETLSGKVGVVVDEVLSQQQVVIKSMGAGTDGIDVFSGAAILSDGRVGLIINVEELVSRGREWAPEPSPTSSVRCTATAGPAVEQTA